MASTWLALEAWATRAYVSYTMLLRQNPAATMSNVCVVGQEEGRRIGATAADEDARRKLRKQIYTKSLQRGATTEEAKDCK